MKLKPAFLAVLAVLGLGLSAPAKAEIDQFIDLYETGQDQLFPVQLGLDGPAYLVLLEPGFPTAPTQLGPDPAFDPSNWSDIVKLFNVETNPVAPSQDPPDPFIQTFAHIYSNTPGPAFADLSTFVPDVQAHRHFFMVEDPSGVTEFEFLRIHEGNVTPEPGTASSALLGLAGLGVVALVRRRS